MPPALPHPPSSAGGQWPKPGPMTGTGEHPVPLSGPPLLSCLPDPKKGNPGTQESASPFPCSLLGESPVPGAQTVLSRLLPGAAPPPVPGEACNHLWGRQPCLWTRVPWCGASSERVLSHGPDRGEAVKEGAVRKCSVTCSAHRKRASS